MSMPLKNEIARDRFARNLRAWRTKRGLSQELLAEHAGLSRVYGRIHFPYGNVAGRALGECIGIKVAERFAVPTRP